MTTNVNDLASVIWASLTGSGTCICSLTNIITHMNPCIYKNLHIAPPGAPGRGGGSG